MLTAGYYVICASALGVRDQPDVGLPGYWEPPGRRVDIETRYVIETSLAIATHASQRNPVWTECADCAGL